MFQRWMNLDHYDVVTKQKLSEVCPRIQKMKNVLQQLREKKNEMLNTLKNDSQIAREEYFIFSQGNSTLSPDFLTESRVKASKLKVSIENFSETIFEEVEQTYDSIPSVINETSEGIKALKNINWTLHAIILEVHLDSDKYKEMVPKILIPNCAPCS